MEKKIVILGAGISGYGAALLAKKQGFKVFVSDQGSISKSTKDTLDHLEVEWEENTHSLSKMQNADFIIKSPGIPAKTALIQSLKALEIKVVSEIEFASQYTKATLIGITGSNGKTTTAMMTYQILNDAGFNVALAGNIGKSFAKEVAENERQFYVLEISSFQLDDIVNFAPHIAVITNITRDHLDRYDDDFSTYIKSKLLINMNQNERDFLIFNGDDPELSKAVKKINTDSILHQFGVTHKNINTTYAENDHIVIETQKNITMINTMEFPLRGRHNLLNAMAASTVAHLLDVTKESIRESLLNFKGAPHRLEPVLKIQKIQYINDSKATNIGAAIEAVKSAKKLGEVSVLCGGRGKGVDFKEFSNFLSINCKNIILFGSDDEEIKFSYDDGYEKYSHKKTFEGVVNNLERRYLETDSDWKREEISQYQSDTKCDVCKGHRLKDEALCVKIDGKHISEITEKSITDAQEWFNDLSKKLDAIMCAHILFKNISNEIPSFSEFWIKEILKNRLNYKGLVISDDLSMKGAGLESCSVKALKSIKAGCDMALICNEREDVKRTLDVFEDNCIEQSENILK